MLYQRDADSIFSNTDPGLGVTQAQVSKSQGAPLGCRPGEVAYRLSIAPSGVYLEAICGPVLFPVFVCRLKI